MMCDECSGTIDSKSGYCISCGLEAVNFDDTEFTRSVLHGSKFSGEEESRQRGIRKISLKSGRGNRGFICHRCREMFDNTVHTDSTTDLDSSMRGFEEAGTNLYTFHLKQDLENHIRVIHEGKSYANKYIRKLNADSNQREKGSEE